MLRGRWAVRVLCLLLCLATGPVQAAAPARVVFLSPDDSRFWDMVSGFMQAVADDLAIELEVVTDHRRHRLSYLQLAQQVLSRPQRPDYLVFMCKENVTAAMLTLASEAGVKVFTFNTDVPRDAQAQLGAPRETLSNWLGHLSPDNVAAGRTLAQMLGQRARDLGLPGAAQPPSMIALTGTLDSSAAKDRNLGLLSAVNDEQARLSQLVHADWNADEAQAKTRVLLKRYPDTSSIWSASDGMALGAIEASKRLGRQPGADLVVGGVDWEPRALEAIRQGELAISLGRHFMGGGLLLLLLHDYHNGQDFRSGSTTLHYQLEPATQANIARVERMLDPANWQRVDFGRFSRARNPAQPPQWQTVDELLDGFASALEAGHGSDGLVSRD